MNHPNDNSAPMDVDQTVSDALNQHTILWSSRPMLQFQPKPFTQQQLVFQPENAPLVEWKQQPIQHPPVEWKQQPIQHPTPAAAPNVGAIPNPSTPASDCKSGDQYVMALNNLLDSVPADYMNMMPAIPYDEDDLPEKTSHGGLKDFEEILFKLKEKAPALFRELRRLTVKCDKLFHGIRVAKGRVLAYRSKLVGQERARDDHESFYKQRKRDLIKFKRTTRTK